MRQARQNPSRLRLQKLPPAESPVESSEAIDVASTQTVSESVTQGPARTPNAVPGVHGCGKWTGTEFLTRLRWQQFWPLMFLSAGYYTNSYASSDFLSAGFRGSSVEIFGGTGISAFLDIDFANIGQFSIRSIKCGLMASVTTQSLKTLLLVTNPIAGRPRNYIESK